MNWKNGTLFLVGAILISGALLANREAVQGQGGKGVHTGAARRTVVGTDGAHLIVTDNETETLYFYAIDKEAKVGDEPAARQRRPA